MTPQILIALIGGGALVLGALVTFVATRGKTRADAKAALDARIDARLDRQLTEAWTRIDDLETKVDAQDRKWAAVGRVFHAIDNQFGTPDLNPNDIALIEDTIPTHWIRR